MEKGESSHTCEERGSSVLFGFFLQPDFIICDDPSDYRLRSPPPTKFLSTSDEGKDLKNGRWGALDASLSFLGADGTVYIIGSSNGLLLCSTERHGHMNFLVCNPITTEFRVLPKPHKYYRYQALAFICEGNPTSLDGVQYKIVRAGESNPRVPSTTLEIETFTSSTGHWEASTLICALPFTLSVCNLPAFVVDKVIYWKDLQCRMVAYNPVMESVELMELPGVGQNFIHWSDLLGQSEGQIHYARHDKRRLEVWVLNNCNGGEWIMKHKASLPKKIGGNPVVHYDTLGLKAFHPWDSQRLLLAWYGKPFWYNIQSRKLDRIEDSCCINLYYYFQYEWPCLPSACH